MSAHLALAVLCLTLVACAGVDSRGEPATVTSVDLSRYAGTWYEIARLFGSSRQGNYWILDLDQEYRTAMVGSPDRRYLWILARPPQPEETT